MSYRAAHNDKGTSHAQADHSRLLAASLLTTSVVAITATTASAADAPPITAATLVDRALIEDILVDYYAGLGSGNDDFSHWYTRDGTLDVNGETARAKPASPPSTRRRQHAARCANGTFRMVLSNCEDRREGQHRHRRLHLDRREFQDRHRQARRGRAGPRAR
ncbi:MAG: hypothetical protein WDO12_02530 [Pseudomonadota bacterium]